MLTVEVEDLEKNRNGLSWNFCLGDSGVGIKEAQEAFVSEDAFFGKTVFDVLVLVDNPVLEVDVLLEGNSAFEVEPLNVVSVFPDEFRLQIANYAFAELLGAESFFGFRG